MNRYKILFLIIFLSLGTLYGQDLASIEYDSEKLEKIISRDAKVEVLADGFQFTEGPYWIQKEQMLLFSDVPGNKVYKWTEEGGAEVYLDPGGYTGSVERGGFKGPNGIILSNQGELLICQHGDRRIARMDAPLEAPETDYVTVAGKYDGKRLNSPNDLFQTPKGDIYFTDPAYGFEKGPQDPARELTFSGVYKMDKGGNVLLLLDSIEQPNGIAVFPGGKKMLVANSNMRKKRIYEYVLDKDGNITDGRIFADLSDVSAPGLCDGLKIDKKGNVFATGPGGIFIYSKEGEKLGKISMNGITAANCALSPDEKTLYITAQQNLLRLKMR